MGRQTAPRMYLKRILLFLIIPLKSYAQVPPPADICTGNYFYQERCDGGWNVSWPGMGPAGFVYQGCGAHTWSVYGETGRRFNIADQGIGGRGYPVPPADDPSAAAEWDKCFILHTLPASYDPVCKGVVPIGIQNPVLRPLAQVSNPSKKASWTAQFGCAVPPTPTPTPPPVGSPYADWIEKLYQLGITAGCQANPPMYCPKSPVTREQMAVYLLKAMMGSDYVPPHCTGIFWDVPCALPAPPSPTPTP